MINQGTKAPYPGTLSCGTMAPCGMALECPTTARQATASLKLRATACVTLRLRSSWAVSASCNWRQRGLPPLQLHPQMVNNGLISRKSNRPGRRAWILVEQCCGLVVGGGLLLVMWLRIKSFFAATRYRSAMATRVGRSIGGGGRRRLPRSGNRGNWMRGGHGEKSGCLPFNIVTQMWK